MHVCIVGAAGGLFTAAFQITVIGTNGMVGVNAANAVKPTNLFLTLCSPLTGVYTYLKEGRLALACCPFFRIRNSDRGILGWAHIFSQISAHESL